MGQDLVSHKVGDLIGDYEVIRREPLEHLAGYYYELIHHGTGARHIHLATEDDNNSFAVTFPTIPRDSTGVAHILEHVVLAGSEKFPVRDPFFSMLPRSLKTFMNALTSYDATAYPFSTRNKKDFFNLLDVYLDATFFPRLAETSFKQEGHRFEFEEIDNPNSGLRFKGVVFNEMKGALASPQYIMGRAIGKGLFPDLTYANYSGGDPVVMPQLTWEQLKEFHSTHYHPSNAFFYTYGNLQLSELFAPIGKVLARFTRREQLLSIPDQPAFQEPRTLEIDYPVQADEDSSKKHQVLVGWVTNLVSDSFDTLAFEVLSEVLLGNASSPLHKALIESKLGDSLADGTGFHTNFRQAVFSAGLKGCLLADAEAIESIVIRTLEDLANNGIEPTSIDAATHQLEIRSREVSNAGFPYSLKVLFRLRPAYVYGGDPYRSLQFDSDIQELHRKVSEGPFFENLIKTRLLDNSHRVRIVAKPNKDLESSLRDEELARLSKIEQSLTNDEKARIVEESLNLKSLQEATQDLSSLPTLELEDIPMQFEDVKHEVVNIRDTTVGLFPQPTNGLTYVDMQFDFSTLPERLVPLLGVFTHALTKSGAAGFDHLEMAARIDGYTGGISCSAGVHTSFDQSLKQVLTLSGKALARNHEPFISILQDFITGATFEPGRLHELIAEAKIESEGSILVAGTGFAQALAAGKLLPESAGNEQIHGLSQIATLRELAQRDEKDLKEIIDQLNEIREHVFRAAHLNVCVTADETTLAELHAQIEGLIGSVPDGGTGAPVRSPKVLQGGHEARVTAAQVAYNARAFKTVGFEHPDAPALYALGNFMRATYLHREIRERGGAYGSMAQGDRKSGLFIFGSYRDPNIARTFQVFSDAVLEVKKGILDDKDVKESILSSCGAIDPLLSPDTKGRNRFFDDLNGYSLEAKAEFKRRLLALTAEDLVRVADSYLTGDGSMATIGNSTKIAQANEEMGGIFEISPA